MGNSTTISRKTNAIARWCLWPDRVEQKTRAIHAGCFTSKNFASALIPKKTMQRKDYLGKLPSVPQKCMRDNCRTLRKIPCNLNAQKDKEMGANMQRNLRRHDQSQLDIVVAGKFAQPISG
jgi:hypothetical protein